MDQWIASLVGFIGASVSTLARETAQRLMSLWKSVTGFFTRVQAGWNVLYNRARRWVDAQRRHALAVAMRLRWIVTIEIPRRISAIADSIVAWTREQIDRAVRLAELGVRSVIDWAGRLITTAVAELRQLRDWALREVAAIRARIQDLMSRVFDTLGSPTRLVEWILAPLVEALWRYALANVARIGALAFRYRQRIILTALDILEDVLVRIM